MNNNLYGRKQDPVRFLGPPISPSKSLIYGEHLRKGKKKHPAAISRSRRLYTNRDSKASILEGYEQKPKNALASG